MTTAAAKTAREEIAQELGSYFEERARTLDELVRRFHYSMVTPEGESLKAQAMAFREAAAAAYRRKDGP